MTHPRNLIVVERGARASVIESYVTLAPTVRPTGPIRSPRSSVAAGAWLEHTRIQRESERAYHVGLTHVDQQRDSHYRSFTLAMGGALARHNLHVRLNDENIETLMYGLYLTRGEQVADNHTAIYHDQPNCRSWEVYKGILDGRSRAVFNGKVFVQPEAQKTDAKQTNRNLLLGATRTVDTKPQLEIFADDVKCTHGATVGRLDDDRPVLRAEPRHSRRRPPSACSPTPSPPRWSTRWRSRRCVEELDRLVLASGSERAVSRLMTAAPPRPPAARRRAAARRTSRSSRSRCAASRWSTSTTRPPARSRRRVIDAVAAILRGRERQHPPRRALPERARHRGVRCGARAGGALPQRRVAGRDRLHPRHDRGHQPRRAELGPRRAPARATRSSSRPWSTTPTSSPGSWWPRRRAR